MHNPLTTTLSTDDVSFCKAHRIPEQELQAVRRDLARFELEFCEKNNVNPAEYARTLARRRHRRNNRVI